MYLNWKVLHKRWMVAWLHVMVRVQKIAVVIVGEFVGLTASINLIK